VAQKDGEGRLLRQRNEFQSAEILASPCSSSPLVNSHRCGYSELIAEQ
jgi:hypothetical protein